MPKLGLKCHEATVGSESVEVHNKNGLIFLAPNNDDSLYPIAIYSFIVFVNETNYQMLIMSMNGSGEIS